MTRESFDQTPEGYRIAIQAHNEKIAEHKERERELLDLSEAGKLSEKGNEELNKIGTDINRRQAEIDRLELKLKNNTY
ncbi:hypothetical protein [Pantoea agglomerans]|uniref:hypothetical protein n=1 Tax=Enterobacter agglomerans TaxID=549 RepID=UPI001FD6E9EC|nr:hypothetical protein [Pantoea agglomerans]UOV19269.1 hypothetical protein LZ609_04630 [Pantoea agglomerans]